MRIQAVKPSKAVTKTESLELVLSLVRTSLFQICYLRRLLPEEDFVTQKLAALDNMRTQVVTPSNPKSRRLIDWIEQGTADAIRRQYLKSLFFGISTDLAGQELLEEYHFSVRYTNEATSVKMTTSADGKQHESQPIKVKTTLSSHNTIPSRMEVLDQVSVRRELCKIMRMLISVCEHLKDVPEKHYVFMNLTYYENCPREYEPPFFTPTDTSRIGHFNQQPVKFDAGVIQTGYHKATLTCRSVLETISDDEDDEFPRSTVTADQGTKTPLVSSLCPVMKENLSGSEYCSDARLTLTASSLPLGTPTTANEASVRGVCTSEAPSTKEDHLFRTVVQFCSGKKQVAWIDFVQEFPSITEELLERYVQTMLRAGALIPTYRSRYYLVGDLHKTPVSIKKDKKLTITTNQPSDCDQSLTIKTGLCSTAGSTTLFDRNVVVEEIVWDSSIQGYTGGALPGSESRDSIFACSASSCGGTKDGEDSRMEISEMSLTKPSGHVDSICESINDRKHKRKASCVEDPIANGQSLTKRARTRSESRITRMRC